jgi:DNA-binding CsgD family transcriptional regulator
VRVALRVRGRPDPGPYEFNRQAQESLGSARREIEVLALIAAGHSNKDIARRLEVSPNTVKTHVSNLFEKLRVQRRTEAIARAARTAADPVRTVGYRVIFRQSPVHTIAAGRPAASHAPSVEQRCSMKNIVYVTGSSPA